ncbi:hypothetical protein [Maribacter sp. 2304DJ31-5]|uniref:hypothetical protein n=1 Tax=Maribacter sp. 2304DJ31-5 TaxID=3386273 RepID=UPI0039BC83E3
MKKKLLNATFCLMTLSLLGQVKMNLILKNGNIKTGTYKIKDNTLGWATKTKIISKNTNEKYNLKDIRSLVMFINSDSIRYEVIKVKKYSDSKKTELKLGQVGLKGNRIELFYVSEYVYQGGAVSNITTVGSYNEIYLKKKNAQIAYNMGYIYGAGQRGVKKRVREFFKDCSLLIEKVDKNEIPKKETMEIALFYENNCKK